MLKVIIIDLNLLKFMFKQKTTHFNFMITKNILKILQFEHFYIFKNKKYILT